jgi:hypothetical protein
MSLEGLCSLKKWDTTPTPIQSNKHYFGFGPGTDCVTVAINRCDSVQNCAAIGFGVNDTSIGDLFDIELYSCTKVSPRAGWTTYRKQDQYNVPLAEVAGTRDGCTKQIDPAAAKFQCSQKPVPTGQNVTVQYCDGKNSAQKFKLDDLSQKRRRLEEEDQVTRGRLEREEDRLEELAEEARRGRRMGEGGGGSTGAGGSLRKSWGRRRAQEGAAGGGVGVHEEQDEEQDEQGLGAKCALSGVWSSGGKMFEIQADTDGFGLNFLALTPTEWLTASGTFGTYDGVITIHAIFDNGESDVGFVSSTCDAIHWGPETPDGITDTRYAWATRCNDSDATQMGWGIQQVDKNDYMKGVIMQYTTPAFDGCLDRRDQNGWLSVGECTGLVSQRFHMISISFEGGTFALQAVDSNLCVDIYSSQGPGMSMFR